MSEDYQSYEDRYPDRGLPAEAVVTRMAPSPTGFVHLGNLVQGLTSERMASKTSGVLFLRVEDTDAKREVEGAVDLLVTSLKHYGINFDEGVDSNDNDYGDYGPYRQRKRKEIYHVYAKKLVLEGKAYPCFCSEDELAAIHEQQQSEKCNFGYYGKWAVWRDRSVEDIEKEIKAGNKWVLRFRSEGDISNKIPFTDLIKGKIDLTENDIDHVLLKSDGIPTYHFAHVIDDHFMRTTHVVRGDEWLSTLPFHIQLFRALGFRIPKYLHIGPLMKMDGQSKRKLSKRKDPEFALSYYMQSGFPVKSVYEYVMTILNSNFEDWRRANREAPATEFPFSYKKMNPAGALFDYAKLLDVSKNVISEMPAEEVYEDVTEWAGQYDPELHDILSADRDYAVSVFGIGREGKKKRKDFAKWDEVREYISIFYDSLFSHKDSFPEGYDKEDIADILRDFRNTYSADDDQNQWFEKVKEIAKAHGYCPDMKEYKASAESYKGSVADVSMFIRIAVTGRMNSPDLCTIMNIIGKEASMNRITAAENSLLGR